MPPLCNKCKRGEAYQSDSWCLGCSAHEQLLAELRDQWGAGGTRAIATDLLVSTLRQVRALRRLGLAVRAGESRASTPAAPPADSAPCGSGRAPSGAEKKSPAPSPKPEVKKEAAEQSSEEESYEEEDEEEEVDTHPTTAPKAKATPGKEGSTGEHPHRDHGRDRSERDEGAARRRSRSVRPYRREELPRLRSRDRRDHHGHRHSHREDRPKKKRVRVGHRGGSKHQRTRRAEEDPYRRFHSRRPGSFWDQDHFES
eukprot:Skav225197  [mRNA]  locus=scaffold3065:266037:266804:+ [translate_table: standard]